jgi:hypothetical protein
VPVLGCIDGAAVVVRPWDGVGDEADFGVTGNSAFEGVDAVDVPNVTPLVTTTIPVADEVVVVVTGAGWGLVGGFCGCWVLV